MSISLACAPHRAFQRQLTETLCCPKKSIFFLQKCCTVPQKPKKAIFSSLGAREVPGPQKDCFFFGTVQHFCKKLNKNAVLYHKNHSFFSQKVLYCPPQKKQLFQSRSPRGPRPSKDRFILGQYSTFARNLTKTLYCTTKTTLFFAKVLYCPKKKAKKQLFQSRSPRGPRTSKDRLFGTVQHCKKLNKNAVLYHKNHSFFRKSAVLSPKKTTFPVSEPARSQDLKR